MTDDDSSAAGIQPCIYVDHHGLRAYCLRIGGVRSPEDPSHPANLWQPEHDHDDAKLALRRRTRAVWLSERDCVHLVECCLASDRDWVLCYGISNNPRRFLPAKPIILY